MNQELLLQASMLEKQSENIQRNLEIIEREIVELEQFNSSLDCLIKEKDKSVLASMGRGIYLKTTLEEKKLFVDVGSGVVVRKSPEDAKKIIENQVKQLREARASLLYQLEASNSGLGQLIAEIEKGNSVKQKAK